MDKRPTFFNHKFPLTVSEMLLGLALIVFGLILVIWPEAIPDLFMNGIGILLIIAGIIDLIRYFGLKDTNAALNSNGMLTGLLMGTAGILLIIFKHAILSFLPAVCALLMLVGGIYKLQATINFRKLNMKRWYIELAFSVLSIIVGVVILVNPFSTAMTLVRVIGIALMVEGVCDLITRAVSVKKKESFILETRFTDNDN